MLEFTRPYDKVVADIERVDTAKLLKYQQFQRLLAKHLPGWGGSTLAFAVGARGTVMEQSWEKALRTLSIPDPHHKKILTTAVENALQGTLNNIHARAAQLSHRGVPEANARHGPS